MINKRGVESPLLAALVADEYLLKTPPHCCLVHCTPSKPFGEAQEPILPL